MVLSTDRLWRGALDALDELKGRRALVVADSTLRRGRLGRRAGLDRGLGGAPMDAAKAVWVLYEQPGIDPAAINPFEGLGRRQRARLVTIPTTSSTRAEVTWAIILTDTEEQRQMGLGNRENAADIAIVDPARAAGMPPQLTADTGLDALTHAVEGSTGS